MAKGLGPVQRKILLLLFGGLALGLAGSPRRYFKILNEIGKGWKMIDREVLQRSIHRLYASRLVDIKESSGGMMTIVLTEQGTERAKVLTYNLDKMKITPPARWDGKWYMVIFDIPTNLKKAREAFRFHLQRLGFYPLQKSVFVYPFEGKNEVDFLVEFLGVRRYVRQIKAEYIDNEFHLREIFKKSLHGVRAA